MGMLGRVITLALLLVNGIKQVHPIEVNLSPPNDSVSAQLVGAVNAAVFECNIFQENSNGELLQTTTTWTLQNFRSISESVLVIQSAFVDIFTISGTPRPPGSFSATYRNRITVLNFVEDLDGAVLMCGTEKQGHGHFNLRVYRPPQLATGLIGEVVEGRGFSLDLSRGRDPFPYPRDFQWTRNDGAPLRNASRVSWGYPSVVIRNVSRTDRGQYSLSAINYRLDNPSEEIGRETGSFQLDVLYGPDIIRGPTGVVGIHGGEAMLLCGTQLRSNPQASVVWSDNEGNSVDSDNTRTSITSGPESVSLLLRDLAEGDAGNWTCAISVDGVGTLVVSITVVVVGPPSQPRGVTVISSGPTWSRLTWEEPSFPGFPTSSAKLYVVLATQKNGGRGIYESLPTQNLSAIVTGLLPNSDYEVTVLAQSVLGSVVANSTPSGLALATTTTTVPEVECDIAPLSDEGAINITWLYIHTGGLNLSSINLLYSIDQPHPQFRILADVPVPGKGTLGGEPFSFAVQDLPAGNSYIFSITSSNDKGNSSVTCPPVSHSIGIPQKPEIFEASSFNGAITIEVATNESGTEPQDLFQFNIRARHAVTLEVREFEMEAREYRDGEVVELELTGFMKVAEGPVYLVTVSCTNRFGMSEGSDSQTVSIRFSADGVWVPIAGGAAAGLAMLAIIAVILGIVLGYICYRKRHERDKRWYSPARQMEENPHHTQSTSHSNGSANHTSITELSRSLDKEPKSPQYDTILPKSSLHTVYDSLLAPIPVAPPSFPSSPPSLPPPNSSMSSLVKPTLSDSARTSMGHLSQASSSIIRPKLRGSNPQVNLVEIRESRRRSSSVPDMLDQTIDFPIEFLEPISINRDLVELEEMFGTEASARTGHGHVIGFDQSSLGIHSDV